MISLSYVNRLGIANLLIHFNQSGVATIQNNSFIHVIQGNAVVGHGIGLGVITRGVCIVLPLVLPSEITGIDYATAVQLLMIKI